METHKGPGKIDSNRPPESTKLYLAEAYLQEV
jgi:hypothetical protein